MTLETEARRVVLISDSPIIREGIKAMLSGPSMRVVFERSSCEGLKDLVHRGHADLVIAAPVDGTCDQLMRAMADVSDEATAVILLPSSRIRPSPGS